MTIKTATPELTPIARQVYKHLIRVLRKGTQQSVTYGALAEAIGVHRRSSKLHSALTEVTIECRRRAIPAVTAVTSRRQSNATRTYHDGRAAEAHRRSQSKASGRSTAASGAASESAPRQNAARAPPIAPVSVGLRVPTSPAGAARQRGSTGDLKLIS